jgi:hypothetical protein
VPIRARSASKLAKSTKKLLFEKVKKVSKNADLKSVEDVSKKIRP